jgi:hypothetical protein
MRRQKTEDRTRKTSERGCVSARRWVREALTNSPLPYCRATVIKQVDPERIDEVTVLHSFEEVLDHLQRTYNWFVDIIADMRSRCESSKFEPPVGGFGVRLRNRWESEVEIGVGREIWFLIQTVPEPSRCVSDAPELSGPLVFYLAGWHYTELERDMLASKVKCLTALRYWLDMGEL